MPIDSNRVEMEPLEALAAKSFDFGRWLGGGNGANVSVVDALCPRCAGRVICGYADMGAVDYYDTYAHVCLNPRCDYSVGRDLFSTSWGGGGTGAPPCPLCEEIAVEQARVAESG